MTFEFPIRMRHTDAAGVMFFAKKIELAHDAYEAYVEAIGSPLPPDMLSQPIILPIVHVSADYRAPLRLNDRVHISVAVEKVGTRSFAMRYDFRAVDGTDLGPAKTVHVAMERDTGHSIRIPEAIRERLLAAKKGS
jgi:1,4-dihydroxy-2-naphthoyl-CoA hydrolase